MYCSPDELDSRQYKEEEIQMRFKITSSLEEDLKVMGLVEDDLVRGRKHKAWVKDQEKRGSNLVPHLASMDIRNNPAPDLYATSTQHKDFKAKVARMKARGMGPAYMKKAERKGRLAIIAKGTEAMERRKGSKAVSSGTRSRTKEIDLTRTKA